MRFSIRTDVSGLRTCPAPEGELRERIEARLSECIDIVRSNPGFEDFPAPMLAFFNRRSAAGIAHGRLNVIAFNRDLFEQCPEENLHETVAHELAHLVIDYAKRRRMISPRAQSHGREWQTVMRSWFAVEPERTHAQDTQALDLRKQRRWPYRCKCRTHHLSTTRHNKIQKRRTSYKCKDCLSRLEYTPGQPRQTLESQGMTP